MPNSFVQVTTKQSVTSPTMYFRVQSFQPNLQQPGKNTQLNLPRRHVNMQKKTCTTTHIHTDRT